jgi:hypothetical protein
MMDEMNWGEYGSKWSWPNQGTIQAFPWRDGGNPQETSDRIASILVRIRTKHLQNASLKLLLPGQPIWNIRVQF